MTDVMYKSFGDEGLPEGFLDLAPLVYADEPMWIPESREGIAARFSDANPWYERGKSAAFCIPGKGRIATFITEDSLVDGKRTAFFGYWETLGDPAADGALFAVAEDWAREQGAEYLCGPINFSTYSTYRLRLSAEEGGYTFAGESFNPSTYPEILEGMGFAPRSQALTQRASAEALSGVWRDKIGLLEKVRGAGYRIEPFAHSIWLDSLPELHGLIEEMFSANFAYTPLTYAAFAEMCGPAYIRRSDPNTSQVAFAPDGSIAGFLLMYPHYGPLIVQGAGTARVLVGDLSFEEHFPRLKERGFVSGLMKTVAVAPAHREMGVFYAMATAAFIASEGVYDEWFGALVRTDNPSRRYAEGVSAKSRWYALFGKEL